MTTDRLGIYNDALLHCSANALDSLTERVPNRYTLDSVWTAGKGMVRTILEMGQWNFASRQVELEPSTDIEPAFGYLNAFELPEDFVRTLRASADDRFSDPLDNYEEKSGYLYADCPLFYLDYVSDDASYGADLSTWPESFRLFAGAYLASRVIKRITGSLTEEKKMQGVMKDLKLKAEAKDAMEQPTQQQARGSWSRARHGNQRWRERGRIGY